jgi:hypothetical protein
MGKKKTLEAKVAPSKLPRRADVIAVTSDEGDDLEKTRLAAKALHGPNAQVTRVDDSADMANFLAEFESIRRLVFMFHGSPGELLVGSDQVTLSEIGEKLRKAKAGLRCNELIFEACNVAAGGTHIANLMNVLRAHVASGFACFHGWDRFGLVVYKDTSKASIEMSPAFARYKRFIVPGQPTPAEMAHTSGTYPIVVEYFSSTPLSHKDIFRYGLPGEVERLRERRQLERKTFPIRNAKESEQYNTPVGSMTL